MNATNPVRMLRVVGASEHNLKNITVEIPRNTLCVITGLSGSGKSSLAFDTIYAEGQRRYVESLSAYARQFLDQLQKPNVDHIEGLSPAISIEQRTVSRNPRSTVGTVTEIYDYLRVVFANLGEPHCADCGRLLSRQTVQQIVDAAMEFPEGTKLLVLAPVVRGRKGEYAKIFEQARREGFVRAKVNGKIVEIEEPPRLNKKLKHDISIVIDRAVVGPEAKGRLTDSIETALKKADGLVTLEVLAGGGKGKLAVGEHVFSEAMACPEHGPQIVELTPRMFSFNSPYGACPKCNGLGTLAEVDPEKIVADESRTLREGAIVPWQGYFLDAKARPRGEESRAWGYQWIKTVCKRYKIGFDVPFKRLSAKQRDVLLYGGEGEKIDVTFQSESGSRWESKYEWEGLIPRIQRRLKETSSDDAREHYLQYFSDRPCTDCAGARLKRESRAVTFHGKSLSEFTAMTVDESLDWIGTIKFSKKETQIGEQALKEIRERLQFLKNVGLGYLTLDRTSGTLAGGEGQRIRLATQIGSQLVGVLYILDEPSIGLHQRDNHRLIETLTRLRDLGNTIIVVEHDEKTILAADYVVDLGPGAGRLGGEVVAAGTPKEVMACASSLTGAYLRGDEKIPVPAGRRKPKQGEALRVLGARQHNLKNIDVEIPLGLLVSVTGVSGSGKSTLVTDILYARLAQHFYGSSVSPGAHRGIEGLDKIDKVIDVDQSPIGRTPRSNPATYVGLLSIVRDLFAQLPEARVRGYKPGRFSFNVKGGRCEACRGDGLIKIEMHFLPDVYVECETCRSRRYNRETLEVLYRGKNIADVLEMTVEEALEFFSAVPTIKAKLQTLFDVGLGYIHLGQSATTLSGGEAQRVKLTKELSKRNTGRTLYLLDEPTTGLHFHDIRKLLEVLNRLVEQGSTVVVIEHNLDVIKTADYVIDLGPEGGEAGGRVVATGTPEEVAKVKASHTGKFLKEILAGGDHVAPRFN